MNRDKKKRRRSKRPRPHTKARTRRSVRMAIGSRAHRRRGTKAMKPTQTRVRTRLAAMMAKRAA